MIARCPGLVAAQEANELVQMQFCKAKPCWYIFLGSFSRKQMQRCHICSMFFLLYYVELEHLTWITEACGV